MTMDWARGRELYLSGCNDTESARQLGCDRTSVRRWRIRNALPPHLEQHACFYDWVLGLDLYRSGCNDCTIAQRLGCGKTTVLTWRRRIGLPAQKRVSTTPRTTLHATAVQMVLMGCTYAEAGKRSGLSRSTVAGAVRDARAAPDFLAGKSATRTRSPVDIDAARLAPVANDE